MGKHDWEDFLLDAQELADLCDEIEGKGANYAHSVQEKTFAIMNTVEDREFVTDRQWEAVKNMRAGVEKWVES